MKIAPDVFPKIKKLFDGKCSEEEVLQKLISDNTVRHKKEAIKIMVRQFFSQNKNGQQPTKRVQIQSQPQDLGQEKLKKKRKTQPDYRFEPKESHNLKNLGGIEIIVEKIQNYILMPIQEKEAFKKLNVKPSRGFMIIGSMGSGKTQLGFSILNEVKTNYGINTFYLTSSQLIKDSEDTLQKLFKVAIQSKPSMIFIDDIDQLCTKQNKKQSSALSLLSSQFDKTQDEQIYMLASTSEPQKVDMLLKRSGRFDLQIVIDNPNQEGRAKILEKLLENVNTNVRGQQAKISSATAGFVAADLVGLVKQAAMQCVMRSKRDREVVNKKNEELDLPKQAEQTQQKPDMCISEEDFMIALSRVEPLCKKQGFTIIPDVTLDDVGALTHLKQQLNNSIILPIKERERFKKMHVSLSAGLLLYGPPGCGKTMLAKAIANAAKANFITVKGPELLSKYVGQSEQSVRQVFQRAKLSAPCIIFFDQFDALAPKRQDQGNQVTQRVVNTLLNELNGVEDRRMVFVIAATNRPDIIDEAILRSGRIEKHLLVPLPTPEDRVAILKAIVRKINIDPLIPLAQIAKNNLCEGFSGADLQHLVKQACILAIMANRQQLLQQDLLKSLEKIVVMKRKIS